MEWSHELIRFDNLVFMVVDPALDAFAVCGESMRAMAHFSYFAHFSNKIIKSITVFYIPTYATQLKKIIHSPTPQISYSSSTYSQNGYYLYRSRFYAPRTQIGCYGGSPRADHLLTCVFPQFLCRTSSGPTYKCFLF